MRIGEIIRELEGLAHPSLQEGYDNAGLITGSADWTCTGLICALDSTLPVIEEAIRLNCNLVLAHHPIVFGGLKKLSGEGYVERTVVTAIKHDIAIYAIHTNLDNVVHGVNNRIADKLGLLNRQVLAPKANSLQKLYCFVPTASAEKVRSALFAAGAGHIGAYSECSFNTEGLGTFKAGKGADPFVGGIGERHTEPEIRLEMIVPTHLKNRVIEAMRQAHPYEEVAFDLVSLTSPHPGIGAGLIGELPERLEETALLAKLKELFRMPLVRHSPLRDKPIQRVALCGGAGSFLITNALAARAEVFITADLKYHDFFEANDRILLADIGHFESEQYTTDLLYEVLVEKFPNFAVLKTAVDTNPVRYF